MSQYVAGTVTLSSGSPTVTGSGTAFLANVAEGDVFSVTGSKVPYFVGSVDSDTQVTLTGDYAGTSGAGQSYAITTSLTPANSIPYMEYGDSDTPTIFKAAMIKLDTLLNALATGTAGAVLFLGSAGAIASDYAGISFNSTTDKLTVAGALQIGGALSGVTTLAASDVVTVTKASLGALTVLSGAAASRVAIALGTDAVKGYIGISGGTSSIIVGDAQNDLDILTGGAYNINLSANGGTTKHFSIATTGAITMSSALAITGALSGVTTLAASGQISSTLVDPNLAQVFSATTASTGAKTLTVQNTGGQAYFGVEKSTGSYVVNGSTAYDAIINGSVGVSIGVNSSLVCRFSSTGLTINQGANDDEILAFKSSDVAHGMTSNAETDTYGTFLKASATDGGLFVNGYSEGPYAIGIIGRVTTEDSTRSTSAVGAVFLQGETKSGTASGNMGADKNIVVIRSNGTARFIFDTDGDSHQDVGTAWTNFDAHNDVAVMDALAITLNRGDTLRTMFVKSLEDSHALLRAMPGKPLVTFNNDGHHFANMSRVTMLHHGAIRQIANRVQEHDDELRDHNTELADLRDFKHRATTALAQRGITLH